MRHTCALSALILRRSLLRPDDEFPYAGTVDSFNPENGEHCVVYVDGQEEWLTVRDATHDACTGFVEWWFTLTRIAMCVSVRVTCAQVAEEQVRLLLHAGEMPPDAAPPAPAAEEEEAAPPAGAPAEAAPGAPADGSGAEGAGDDAADAAAASAAAEAGAGGADGDAAVAELASAPLPEGYDAVGHRVAVFWSGDGTWCAPDAVVACYYARAA